MLLVTHLSGFSGFSSLPERMTITYQLSSSATTITDLVWRIRRYSGWNGTSPCDLHLIIPTGASVSGPLSLSGFPETSTVSLTIQTGGTLTGSGNLGDILSIGTPECIIVNNGTISGSSGKTISVNAEKCSIVSSGLISAAAGGTTIEITHDDFILTNTGTVKSTNGKTIVANRICTVKNTGQISSVNGSTIIGNVNIVWNPAGTISGPVS